MQARTKEQVRRIRDCRHWRDRVRPQQLLDFPYCQTCIEKDELVPAKEVDHIIPLEEGGEPFDPANLRSQCKRCHVIKTAEENRQRNNKAKTYGFY